MGHVRGEVWPGARRLEDGHDLLDDKSALVVGDLLLQVPVRLQLDAPETRRADALPECSTLLRPGR
eukprot:3341445-Lingulodinium_polyedra.AAC.1